MQANGLKTALLLGGMSGMLLLLGEIFGGRSGLMMMFMVAVVMNFVSYFFSEKIALMMYQAQPVTPAQNTQIYHRIQPTAAAALSADADSAAQALGPSGTFPQRVCNRTQSVALFVAFTGGLLELMNDREVEGVLAHELAHIKNRDILTSSDCRYDCCRHHDDRSNGHVCADWPD